MVLWWTSNTLKKLSPNWEYSGSAKSDSNLWKVEFLFIINKKISAQTAQYSKYFSLIDSYSRILKTKKIQLPGWGGVKSSIYSHHILNFPSRDCFLDPPLGVHRVYASKHRAMIWYLKNIIETTKGETRNWWWYEFAPGVSTSSFSNLFINFTCVVDVPSHYMVLYFFLVKP